MRFEQRLAERATVWPLLHTGFDAVEIASAHGLAIRDVAAVEWAIFDRLDLAWLWDGIGLACLVVGVRWLTPDRTWARAGWALTFLPVFWVLSYGQNSLLSLTLLHLRTVFLATLAATVVAVGMAVLVTRPFGREFLPLSRSLVNIGQTFPPVAVLALAVPAAWGLMDKRT